MELFLNELSAASLPSVDDARRVMSRFVAVLSEGTALGFQRMIRTSIDLSTYVLADAYSVARWRNDEEVDKDEKAFFRRLTTRFPVDHDHSELRNTLLGCEFHHQERLCIGLGAAYIIDSVCVSFAVAGDWAVEQVTIRHTFLNDDSGEYEQDDVRVRHASDPAHIKAHEQWVVNTLRDVVDGADLYARREDILPRLIFSNDAGALLSSLTEGHLMLHPVAKKLFAFQDCAAAWKVGQFDLSKLPMRVTPESKSTMNKFGDARIFKMPSGHSVSFPWHARLTGLPWRIHFGWDEKERKIIIGYIGKHLPTVTDPT